MKILCWIRQIDTEHPYMKEEIGYINDDLERYHREVGAGFWKPFKALKESKIRYRFFLGGMLFVFQNGKNPCLETTPSPAASLLSAY